MRVLCVLSCVAIVPLANGQEPLTSTFSYQGQLLAAGTPAEGTFAMQFALYDAPEAGALVGPPLIFDGLGGNPSPVVVENGLFAAPLDFGIDVFNGDARWLQVTVEGTVLSPRQELVARPYALVALRALTAAPPVPLTLGGTEDPHVLRADNASPSGTGVLGVHTAATGSRPGVHGATLSTAVDAVGVLGEVVPTSPGSASAAVRGLNRGTGEFGFGVFGSQDGSGVGAYGTSVSGRGVYGLATSPTGSTYGVYGTSVSTSGAGVFGLANAADGTTYGVLGQATSPAGYGGYFLGRGYFSGNVGIGLTNPGHPLDVNGVVQMTGFRLPPGATTNRVLTADASGNGTWQNISSAMLPVPMLLSGTNSVGIVQGTNASRTDGAAGVIGRSTATEGETAGVYGAASNFDGCGVWGHNDGPLLPGSGNAGVRGTSVNGHGVSGISEEQHGVSGWSNGAGEDAVGVFGSARLPGATGVLGWARDFAQYGVRGDADYDTGVGVFGVAGSPGGLSFGGHFKSLSTAGTGVKGEASAASGNTVGVLGESASPTGIGVLGRSAVVGGVGLQGTAAGWAVVGQSTSPTGNSRGGRFECASVDGIAVEGSATAATGDTKAGSFTSVSPSGTGVWARGGLYGGEFETHSGVAAISAANFTTSGTADGLSAQTNSTSGRGVYGLAVATSGTPTGVYGESRSNLGRGVYGVATAATGTTYGGYFDTNSVAGSGVYGRATTTSGLTVGVRGQSNSTAGVGVYGYASTTTGTTYGVYGQINSSSTSAYAVWAQGRLGASGTKSFRIDHPDDPENKYLVHYSTESPEVLNTYSGTVTLDDRGTGLVELPPYFARINTDPRYMLTAVGAPMPTLHIAAEIDEAALAVGATAAPGAALPRCTFRIAGGAPRGKVCWRVEAIRNDPWMRANASAVEVAKEGNERGTYLNPELYGQPAERGLRAELTQEAGPATLE